MVLTTIQAGEVVVVHRGTAYSLCELLDLLVSRPSLLDQVESIAEGKTKCLQEDQTRMEGVVSVLARDLAAAQTSILRLQDQPALRMGDLVEVQLVRRGGQ